MIPLTVGSLFSGIGGFELGLERTGGFKTVWQCEIDPFCQKILEKHWPDVKRFTDIKKMGIEEGIPHVNVICGGFPCQPVSCAGKRKGKEDERWLWPEFCRVVRCVRPEWVLVENVPGLLSADSGRLFAGILRDLSESGYDAEWNIVSAASVGAPHLRKRVFLVAHTSQPGRQQITRSTHGNETEDERWTTKENNEPDRDGESGGTGHVADSDQTGLSLSEMRFGEAEGAHTRPGNCSIFRREPTGTWPIESGFCRMADGIPSRVDRLRALGNAIVPQCSQFVGQCVLDSMEADA